MFSNNLVLFFDGACTKNPGGVATFGYKISCKETNFIYTASGEVCRGSGASSVVAEWGALLNALEYLKGQGWSGNIEIFGDSELIIKQLSGEYRVQKDHLIPYYRKCKEILIKK